MAKLPRSGDQSSIPNDYPQTPPRDLYPTSDIRFVLIEIGKLNANVERLIADVKSQGDKLDNVRHQVTFTKGAVWAAAAVIAAVVAVASFVLSSKWDAAIQALRAVSK